MTDSSRQSLGQLLVERGVITPEQLDTALGVQRDEGGLLGEILTSRGWVTPLSVAAALARQETEQDGVADGQLERPGRGGLWKPLGTLLIERGFVTDAQLEQALAVQRKSEGFLGEILVDSGSLAASDLVVALAAQLGLDSHVKRAAGAREEMALPPADQAEAQFEVLENVGGEFERLKVAATFMEATDYVFDDVLWQREPDDLQIVRVDQGRREIVWSFTPGEAASHSRQDMLSVFGYAVGSWEDQHKFGSDGQSLAASA